MRTLIYVPMVHSEADLGTMAEEVRRKLADTVGAGAAARRAGLVDAMWDGIRRRLLGEPVTWARVRLYQDGLPVCGWEDKIVRDVAATGSKNHLLLLDLVKRGATLMGTEDAALVVREYRRVQRLVEAARSRAPDEEMRAIVAEGDEILAARDAFIARRIDETLAEDEVGILFAGLLHRVDELLSGKLEVKPVIHSLPFGADRWRKREETNSHDDS